MRLNYIQIQYKLQTTVTQRVSLAVTVVQKEKSCSPLLLMYVLNAESEQLGSEQYVKVNNV